MIDSHCHIDLLDFEQGLDGLFSQLITSPVKGVLAPAIHLLSCQQLTQWQHRFPHRIDVAFGQHPCFLNEKSEQEFAVIEQLAAENCERLVAIGETGLDGKCSIDAQWQKRSLIRHIALANQLDLPVILHYHAAENELLSILKRHPVKNGGAIHAFSGSIESAKRFIDKGFYLGIGGIISYPRANKTRRTVAAIGMAHLLLETDAPSMPLCGFQGKKNSPLMLPLVAAQMSELLDQPVNTISAITSHNYRTVFQRTSLTVR